MLHGWQFIGGFADTSLGGLNYATPEFSLGLDYAYKYLGVLGATNFFTLSVGW
jgi:hypothetical protein